MVRMALLLRISVFATVHRHLRSLFLLCKSDYLSSSRSHHAPRSFSSPCSPSPPLSPSLSLASIRSPSFVRLVSSPSSPPTPFTCSCSSSHASSPTLRTAFAPAAPQRAAHGALEPQKPAPACPRGLTPTRRPVADGRHWPPRGYRCAPPLCERPRLRHKLRQPGRGPALRKNVRLPGRAAPETTTSLHHHAWTRTNSHLLTPLLPSATSTSVQPWVPPCGSGCCGAQSTTCPTCWYVLAVLLCFFSFFFCSPSPRFRTHTSPQPPNHTPGL